MNIEKIIHVLAGVLILLSVLLSLFVSTWWLILSALVGFNLLVDGLTGFCTARLLLNKLLN